MRAFKFRRLTVTVPLVLLASLAGTETMPSGAQPRKQTPNPTTGTAWPTGRPRRVLVPN
jgi:hypothetical protein